MCYTVVIYYAYVLVQNDLQQCGRVTGASGATTDVGSVDVVIIMVTHYYTLFFASYSASLFFVHNMPTRIPCLGVSGMIMKPLHHVMSQSCPSFDFGTKLIFFQELFQSKFDIPSYLFHFIGRSDWLSLLLSFVKKRFDQ